MPLSYLFFLAGVILGAAIYCLAQKAYWRYKFRGFRVGAYNKFYYRAQPRHLRYIARRRLRGRAFNWRDSRLMRALDRIETSDDWRS